MKNNKSILNTTKSKYFYAITLLSLWLGTQVFHRNLELEPNDSLQLSSEVTGQTVATDATEKYYDLQLRLLENQTVTIESTNQQKVLSKGTIVSMNVPLSMLNDVTDPSRINLDNVVLKLPRVGEAPYIPRNEVVISETDRVQAHLIGETAKINLRLLAKGKKLKVERIEEEIDEDSGEDDGSEASCENCLVPNQTPGTESNFNIVEWSRNLIGATPTSMAEAVRAYEKSSVVSNLMKTLNNGFSIQVKGRSLRVKANKVSRSYKACWRGVKTALLKGGLTDGKYMGGGSAKGAGPHLVQKGFIDLMKTDYKSKIKKPSDAPLGSVLVYSGGKHGHSEIRTSNGFISDYYSNTARTGNALSARGRTLIGVYIKSTSEVKNYLARNGQRR